MKIPRQNLRIPGPIPCPSEVMDALTYPMINHRGPEFQELLLSITERLKKVFMTEHDLYIFTSSGTGALEASLTNTLSPGDKVLAVITGSFGQRYADMAEAFGAEVNRLEVEWGTAADPESVAAALDAEPETNAVLVTHNETSTGVTNDLEAISKKVKARPDRLLLVDAISSLGCIPLPADRWGCDVVAAGSQKGLLVPPGLSFITFSPLAWEAQKTATMPRYYFDVAAAQRYFERGQTPYTPVESLFFGLDRALDILLDRGMEEIFSNHAYIANLTRQGIKGLGLQLLADDSCVSNTVTAVRVPEGVDAQALISLLRTEHNVVVAGGLVKLQGKILRIGHMGIVEEEEVTGLMDALRASLPKVGFAVPA